MGLGRQELALDLIRVLINSNFVEDDNAVIYCPLCNKDAPPEVRFADWGDEPLHEPYCAISSIRRLIKALRKCGWTIDKGPGD